MKKLTKAGHKRKVKDILETIGLTRDDAKYIIKEYLGLTFIEFSEIYKIKYHYLNDSLMAKRPFTENLQDQIKEAAFTKLVGKKVTIEFI